MHPKKIFSVFEITTEIKSLLEGRFTAVEVQGEVTNYKLSSTGHHYFTLKDEKASLNCVLFKTRPLKEGFIIKNGDLLIANGSIGLYEPSGSYQLIVKTVAKAGIGELLAKIHALKEHFQSLGYFDPKRKKLLPKIPKKIAIVTALTGAVIQDIIKVLNRRVHSYHLRIYPVKVQGDGASLEIKEAIETIDQNGLADVIIIARGGGSFEDLLPFNDKILVEAIYQSKTPVISAVGHEVDYTLCDLVSDLRAPTPSAAAEVVLPHTLELVQRILFLSKRIQEKQHHFITKIKKGFLSQSKYFNQKSVDQLISQPILKLESAAEKLESKILNKLTQLKERLQFSNLRLKEKNPIVLQKKRKEELLKFESNLKNLMMKILISKNSQNKGLNLNPFEKAFSHHLRKKKELLKSYEQRLSALNPHMILQKGYCIPFYQNSNSIILTSQSVPDDEPFDLLFHDGKKQVSQTQLKEPK